MVAPSPYSPMSARELASHPSPYPLHYSGRGIVISAGGSYLPSAYVTIRCIRSTGCTLPIQIWHLGIKEFPRVLHPLFDDAGIQIIDSLEVSPSFPFGERSGWQNKPFSILHSSFEEVLFIDADNIPLRDPSFLFEEHEYQTRGAIFWPDFLSRTPQYWSIKQGAWELLGLTPRQDAETESGQLLIHKRKSWDALQVTLHMNEHADYYYQHCSYGDKDTFTLAWDLCHKSPFRVSYRPQIVGQMVRHQFAPDGTPLFVHGRKWVLPSDKNERTSWYPREEECLTWLREFELAFAGIRSKAT